MYNYATNIKHLGLWCEWNSVKVFVFALIFLKEKSHGTLLEMEVVVYDWLSWNVFQWICLDDSLCIGVYLFCRF